MITVFVGLFLNARIALFMGWKEYIIDKILHPRI